MILPNHSVCMEHRFWDSWKGELSWVQNTENSARVMRTSAKSFEQVENWVWWAASTKNTAKYLLEEQAANFLGV